MEEFHSFEHASAALKNGSVTCVQLVNYFIERIKNASHLNAFLEVYEHEAIERAHAIDAKLKAGTAGKLAGMVIGLKDVICHKGHKLSGASKILEGFTSMFDATVTQRLLDADAIIIGRQNCDEFAMGSSTENSAYGKTYNAAGHNRVPGGSSGGSAVAVQAGLCMASLGSDTGGSVRQPASFCGVVGLKPTYSRISRYGLIAYASSFDCIGIFANSVKETALILETIAGEDEYDSTVSRKEVPLYSLHLNLNKKTKIGYVKEGLESSAVSPAIRSAMADTIQKLKNEGHTVEPVEIPYADYILPTYYILTTAEASSNLSRYDGVKFGYRTPGAHTLEQMYKKTRSEGFGEEVKRRIMLGTFVLSASYYDAFYTKAQKIRRLIKDRTDELMEQYDFLILPAAPTTAFTMGQFDEDTLAMYLADIFTVQANLAGIPGISVPTGNDEEGMPIGLQVLSGSFKEQELLAFSDYLSQLN